MERKCYFQKENTEKSMEILKYCSMDIIDTQDHIAGGCCAHGAALQVEATLEQVGSRFQLAMLSRNSFPGQI